MLIHLEKLGKSFGEKVVLHDVSASVEKEDRIGIVGQNGAGKSTLLHLMAGELAPDSGTVEVLPMPVMVYRIGWLGMTSA